MTKKKISDREKHSKEFRRYHIQGLRDAARGIRKRRYDDKVAHSWWLIGFEHGMLMGDRLQG
ncbi:MAG: hypothetical protein AAF327_13990 [Cyanobacteria bacterium P01_A01_bin.37]